MTSSELITPKVAVNCALFNEADHILLVQRKDNNLWCMPGGFMDLGEQVFDVNDLPPIVESHRQRIADVLANAPDVFIR